MRWIHRSHWPRLRIYYLFIYLFADLKQREWYCNIRYAEGHSSAIHRYMPYGLRSVSLESVYSVDPKNGRVASINANLIMDFWSAKRERAGDRQRQREQKKCQLHRGPTWHTKLDTFRSLIEWHASRNIDRAIFVYFVIDDTKAGSSMAFDNDIYRRSIDALGGAGSFCSSSNAPIHFGLTNRRSKKKKKPKRGKRILIPRSAIRVPVSSSFRNKIAITRWGSR